MLIRTPTSAILEVSKCIESYYVETILIEIIYIMLHVMAILESLTNVYVIKKENKTNRKLLHNNYLQPCDLQWIKKDFLC